MPSEATPTCASSSNEDSLRDPDRLRALEQSNLLDSPPEPSFDAVARLAAMSTGAPVGLVTLVDERRQFFKARSGLPPALASVRETPLSQSLCAIVVRTGTSLIVNDARTRIDLQHHGAVTELGIVAYAGVPLLDRDGRPLGAVCAVDSEARRWKPEDVRVLEHLSTICSREIDLLAQLRAQAGAFAGSDEAPWNCEAAGELPFDIEHAARLLGHAPRTCTSLRLLIHELDLAEVEEELRNWERSRFAGQLAVEYRARKPDGSFVRLRSTGRLVERAADGRSERIAGTTRRIEAERDRRLQEARIAGLAERFNDIELLSTMDGEIMDANDQAVVAYGVPREKLYGKNIRELSAPSDAASLDLIRQHFVTDGRVTFETEHLRADGTPFPVLVTARVLKIGEQRYGHSFIRDLTESHRVQARLRHARMLDGLTVMAAGVAHDFNNLMFSILTNTSELLEYASQGSAPHMLLENVKLGAQRAADLTQQLLVYAGKGKVTFGNVSLAALVEETATFTASGAAGRVTLSLDIARSLPLVTGDATQLRQVVMNLVTNAIDAIPDRGKVVVSLQERELDEAFLADAQEATLAPGRYLVLTVTDDGVGMNTEVMSRVFDPFFTTKQNGRGLGLASTLGVLRAHGGAVRVGSTLGHGSSFEVVLPLRGGARLSSLNPQSARGGHVVLLAEDEPTLRETLARALRRAGFEVVTTADGQEAFDEYRARRGSVHSMVIDLRMPRKGGAETIAEIREIDPDLHIVVMTGYADEAAKRLCASDSHMSLLLKPFHPSDLVTHLLSFSRPSVEP